MEWYRGTLQDFIYIFIHYVSLSNPIVIVAMLAGAISAGISIAMILARPLRKYIAMSFVFTMLTIFLGLAGSILNIRETNEAAAVERVAGLTPSAQRYYDAEYGYNKIAFFLFPFMVGIMSAMPSILMGIVLAKKKNTKEAGTPEDRFQKRKGKE